MHAREFPKDRIVVGHENARLVVEDIGEGAIAPGCRGMRGRSGASIGLMGARLRRLQLPLRFAQALNKLRMRLFREADLLGQYGLACGRRFAEQADADLITGAPANLDLARDVSPEGARLILPEGASVPSSRQNEAQVLTIVCSGRITAALGREDRGEREIV
jgi:hypothetical protein